MARILYLAFAWGVAYSHFFVTNVLRRHKRYEHRNMDVSKTIVWQGDYEPRTSSCLDIYLLGRPIEGSSLYNIINLQLEYVLVLLRHLVLVDHEYSRLSIGFFGASFLNSVIFHAVCEMDSRWFDAGRERWFESMYLLLAMFVTHFVSINILQFYSLIIIAPEL